MTTGSQLLQLIIDGREFIRYFRSGIEEAPLQIYYSGVLFSPKTSTVPQPWANRQYPGWVTKPVNADSEWPQNLHTSRTDGAEIRHIAFLPDGRLAEMSVDNQINLWDPKTGSRLLTISSNKGWISIPFSVWRDNRIAVPSNNSIDVWDASNGTLSQKVVIEDQRVTQVTFSNDGKFICSRSIRLGRNEGWRFSRLASQDSGERTVNDLLGDIIHIHNLSTGACVRTFSCNVILPVDCLSPKGQWIAAENLMLAKWDPYNDLCWVVLEPSDKHTKWGFSADGTLLASITFDPESLPEIKIWCTESQNCLHTYTIQDTKLVPQRDWGPALSKDLLVYKSTNGNAGFVNLKTGQMFQRRDIPLQDRFAMSYDGKTLAVQLSMGVIKIWDLASISLATAPDFHSGPVCRVAPIANGNTVISMTHEEVKIWDTLTGHCKETLQWSIDRYLGSLTLATATNAPLYATWSFDQIIMWHIDPADGIQQIPQEYAILARPRAVAISADGERLAICLSGDVYQHGTVKIWDLKSASLLQELSYGQNSEAERPFSLLVTLSCDGARVAYDTPTGIKLHDVMNPQSPTLRTLTNPYHGSLSHLSFNNGRILAITDNNYLQSFDDKTGDEVGRCTIDENVSWETVDESFINIEAVCNADSQRKQPISIVTKSYYAYKDGHWLYKNGENILWLPPDYVPESACVMGSTVVIGTVSGRVLFLHLKDWNQ